MQWDILWVTSRPSLQKIYFSKGIFKGLQKGWFTFKVDIQKTPKFDSPRQFKQSFETKMFAINRQLFSKDPILNREKIDYDIRYQIGNSPKDSFALKPFS